MNRVPRTMPLCLAADVGHGHGDCAWRAEDMEWVVLVVRGRAYTLAGVWDCDTEAEFQP